MKIDQIFIAPNEYSRPQKPLREILGVVIHWTANPAANAEENRRFFESRKTGAGGYGSAHYIIGQDGEILQCIPTTEIAYHVGSSQIDPKSGKIYTTYAREKYSKYARAPKITSPNFCTIGIELCPTDNEGNFTEATITSAVDLCAYLCRKFKLSAEDITTHHDIVGWKDCPRLWTNKPALLEAFRASVRDALKRGTA